jgi:hypothetical protein
VTAAFWNRVIVAFVQIRGFGVFFNRVFMVGLLSEGPFHLSDRGTTFSLQCNDVAHRILVEDEALVMANQSLLKVGSVVSVQGEMLYDSDGAYVAVRSRRGSDLSVLATADGRAGPTYRNLDEAVPANPRPLAPAAPAAEPSVRPASAPARTPESAAAPPRQEAARPPAGRSPSRLMSRETVEDDDAPPPGDDGEVQAQPPAPAMPLQTPPSQATQPPRQAAAGSPAAAGQRFARPGMRPASVRPQSPPPSSPAANPPVGGAPVSLSRTFNGNDDIPF